MSFSQWKKQHAGGDSPGLLLVRTPKLLLGNKHKWWAEAPPTSGVHGEALAVRKSSPRS